ncbi:MAG TPA: protein translocase subunit SecD [Acidimicrobiales bacterium]|jgi:preprotein translocase subunit SecD|nr:protein translocase subunit SecD [Acidimicrobiales bacterium]
MRRSLWLSLIGIVGISALAFGGVLAAGWSPLLGLDLEGGVSVVLQPKNKVDSGVLNQSIGIIRNRVDALGVAEPEITRQGSSIIVSLPGIKDTARALQVVGQTAELRFRPVIQQVPTNENTPLTPISTTTSAAPPTTAEGAAPGATSTTTGATSTTEPAGIIKTTSRADDKPDAQVVLPLEENGKVTARYLLGPVQGTGKIIRTAAAQVDPSNGRWLVTFETTGKGSSEWDQIAAANLQKQLAIVLDGVIKSAPVIQTANFGGRGQITGNFSQREAKDLALVLRYGSLPVELKQATVQTVSPTLGRDSLHAGIVTGLFGIGLVALYMILYYRALGIVVVLGLGVTAALTWAIVAYLSHTRGLALTISGVVGVIVSLGVTVDSYVVYFERLKDEIRSGKTVRSSVDRGFSRAFRTILAANAVSFIGAALLYWLTVGSVRGFAFFLALSTVIDVIIAYFFTRPVVVLLGRNRLFTEARWLGVARGLNARTAGSAT